MSILLFLLLQLPTEEPVSIDQRQVKEELATRNVYLVKKGIQFCRNRSKPGFDANHDVEQIVWDAFALAVSEYDPSRGSFEPFFFLILKNRFVEHLRKRFDFNHFTLDPSEIETKLYEDTVVSFQLSEGALSEALEQSASVRWFEREIFQLHLRGYTHREVAEILGATDTTTYLHLKRCHRIVRDMIESGRIMKTPVLKIRHRQFISR